jgi:hypothetical protein
VDFFEFEQEFVDALRCIPMGVRCRLDTCGIKLKLHQWNLLTLADRQLLVDQPCESAAQIAAYRSALQAMVQARTGETATDLPVEAHPEWQDRTEIPESVGEKARSEAVVLTLDHWAGLSPLQRFALIKLSRSAHENRNFVPALREFGVVSIRSNPVENSTPTMAHEEPQPLTNRPLAPNS